MVGSRQAAKWSEMTLVGKVFSCPGFNPRTGGGGVDFNPPWGFSQIAKKTAARSAAKFAIAVQLTIWHI